MTATSHDPPPHDGSTSGPRSVRNDPLWSFAETAWTDNQSLLGYAVFGTDRQIGRVELAVNEPGQARIEVSVERWPSTGRRVVPAGLVAEVDHGARMVMLNLGHQQVENGPEISPGADPIAWREQLDQHFRPHLRCVRTTDRDPNGDPDRAT